METEDSGNLILNVDTPIIDVDITAPAEKMLRWTVTVCADGDELILPLPDDMLVAVGWGPGDVLEWIKNNDESWTLRKKEQSGNEGS
jgi:hypothetical protein